MREVQAAGKGKAQVTDVTIFTTGDRERGLGHIVRMKLLARLLTVRGISVGFISVRDTPGWDLLAQTGLPMTNALPEIGGGSVGIVDIEHGPTEYLLHEMKHRFRSVVTVYGGHSFPLAAPDAVECLSDLVIVQSLFEFERGPHVLQGTKWLLLDPAYAECKPDVAGHIVVCMGGADPHCLTGRAAHALVGIGRTVICIIGQAADNPFTELKPLNALAVHAPSSLVPHLSGASLFVGALGMVAYEALAAGVPCVLTNWSDNHRDTTAELNKGGVAANLGLWSEFSPGTLCYVVEMNLRRDAAWAIASQKARELVDGQGALRVADAVAGLLR